MDFFGYSAIMEQFERVYRESNLADKNLATIEGEQADPRLNLFTLKCRLTELLDISSFRLERGKHSVSLMGHMAEKKVGEMALKHSWSQEIVIPQWIDPVLLLADLCPSTRLLTLSLPQRTCSRRSASPAGSS